MSTFHDDNATPLELYERPHWYACRAGPGRKRKKVETRLEQSGIETFLPLVNREPECADRTKKVAVPLFPGFVFARFPLTQLHSVITTYGVATVLQPNGAGIPECHPLRD